MSNENQVDWIVERVHPVTGEVTLYNEGFDETGAVRLRNSLRLDGYKTLRLAKASRLKDGELPKYQTPKRRAGYEFSEIESVVQRYIKWAINNKVEVIHMFKITNNANSTANRAMLAAASEIAWQRKRGSMHTTTVLVDAEDFFGPVVEEVDNG